MNRAEMIATVRLICSIIGGVCIGQAFSNLFLGLGVILLVWAIDK